MIVTPAAAPCFCRWAKNAGSSDEAGSDTSFLASLASSQTYYTAGFGLNANINTVVRTSATATYGEIMLRVDNDRYRDWGLNSDLPTVHDIRGVEVAMYDFAPATPQTFGVMGYTESTTTPDLPDVATPLYSVTGIPAFAKQMAIPPPIVPAPTIAALATGRPLVPGGKPGTLRVSRSAKNTWIAPLHSGVALALLTSSSS